MNLEIKQGDEIFIIDGNQLIKYAIINIANTSVRLHKKVTEKTFTEFNVKKEEYNFTWFTDYVLALSRIIKKEEDRIKILENEIKFHKENINEIITINQNLDNSKS